MKKILFLTLTILCSLHLLANDSLAVKSSDEKLRNEMQLSAKQLQNSTKLSADDAYNQNKFASAAQIYQYILKTKGESAYIYYNLGNCYYKLDQISKAILNYERALLLSPGNADIRSNLEIARSKTTDKVGVTPQFFIVTWVEAIINIMGVDAWAKASVIFFMLFIVGLSVYMFTRKVLFKKISFICSLSAFLLIIVSCSFANIQNNKLINRTDAIVITPSVTVKSTPNSSGTDLFIIHEGRKVIVKDNSMKDWKEIKLEDGNVGWIRTSDIEII